MDELISKQGMIDFFLAEGMITAAIYAERMPPAHPERKRGHWINSCCSVCGLSRYNFVKLSHIDAGYRGTWKYCPNCGAEMDFEAM